MTMQQIIAEIREMDDYQQLYLLGYLEGVTTDLKIKGEINDNK